MVSLCYQLSDSAELVLLTQMEPKATGPGGATVAVFELGCRRLDLDNKIRLMGQTLWLMGLRVDGAVLGSLFTGSHIYYLFIITHSKSHFEMSLIILWEQQLS